MPIILERDFPDNLPEFFRPEEVFDGELCKYLIAIRRALVSALPEFPKDACIDSANYVNAKTNLRQVWGYFIDPTRSSNRLTAHGWNETPNGLWYIDLTLQQFNPNFPEVAIVSAQSLNLQPHAEVREKISLNGSGHSSFKEKARIDDYLNHGISGK